MTGDLPKMKDDLIMTGDLPKMKDDLIMTGDLPKRKKGRVVSFLWVTYPGEEWPHYNG